MLSKFRKFALGSLFLGLTALTIIGLKSETESSTELPSQSKSKSKSKLINGSFASPAPVQGNSRQPASVAINPMAQAEPLDNHLEVGELTPLFDALAEGRSMKENPKLKALIQQAALKPLDAFSEIKSAFQNTKSYEVGKRTLLMSGLMEVTVAARDLKPTEFDRMMDDTISFVEDLLKDPDYVEAVLPEGTNPAQAWGLVHHSTYRMNGDSLEASTWNQKLMGLGILKEASLPSTKAALLRISNDRSISPHVAYAARQWARR